MGPLGRLLEDLGKAVAALAGVAVVYAGLFTLVRRYGVGVDIAPQNELAAQLLVMVVSIVMAGIIVTVPILMLMWDQLFDSLVRRVEADDQKERFLVLLRRMERGSRATRRALLFVLLFSAAVLFHILLSFFQDADQFRLTGRTLPAITIFICLCYMLVVLHMLSLGIINAKQEEDLRRLDCAAPASPPHAKQLPRPTTRQLVLLSFLGGFIYVVNLLSGLLIVSATGIPFSGAFIMFFLYGCVAVFARETAGWGLSATWYSLVFGVLALLSPVLGPPAFLPKLAILAGMGLLVDLSYLVIPKTKAASIVGGILVAYGGLGLIVLALALFLRPAYDRFLPLIPWFLGVNWVQGLLAGLTGHALAAEVRRRQLPISS